jgi:hypothetical protein
MQAFDAPRNSVATAWRYRLMVAKLLPVLKWRWHGVGMLQGYIMEGEKELRVHLWSPELILEGIDISGDIHDHRFDLRSDVLVGAIKHKEYQLIPNGVNGTHSVWRLAHNARRQLKIKTQGSDDMVEEPQAYTVKTEEAIFTEGISYIFPKRFYHQTQPITKYAVTLVSKTNQDDGMAGILCPIGKAPVPAFGRPISEIPQKSQRIIAECKRLLED